MFSDVAFHRLLWKEYRQQRALWLAIAILTPTIQTMLFLLIWMAHDYRVNEDVNVVGVFGYALGVVYWLACAGTMFSVEHEASTFDFQRILPANQPRVFWAKVVFAVGSGVAMMAWLWLVTRGVFLSGTTETNWFNGYGLLYLAEVFAWGVLASLLIRNPLWSVIGAIVAQSAMMQFVIPTFFKYDFFEHFAAVNPRLLVSRLVWLAVLFAVDVYVGKLWFEDRLRWPKWRVRKASDFSRPFLKDVELSAYRGERLPGWSRYLWLAWRDGRWLIGGVLLWFGCCWRSHPNLDQWHRLMAAYFIGSYLCGLFAFAPEQWRQRYLFCMERGCSPRRLWLCRQIVFLPPVLLMMPVSICLCMKHPQSFSTQVAHFEFEWAAVIIGPLVCYSAGQFAAMLFRRTAFALAFGVFLTFGGIVWSVTMTGWLAPAWWAIGSWPVIGLFVTWLRANDWVEERTGGAARRRLILGLGIPFGLLLAALATYRVVQIPQVTLPADWDDTAAVLARLNPAEKETLSQYRQVLTAIEAHEQRESYQARAERLKREHPDWDDSQRHCEAFEGFHRDWLKDNAEVVSLLRTTRGKASVPMTLIEADLPPNPESWMPERSAKLPLLMIQQARQDLNEGQLEQCWNDIEVAFDLQRDYDRRDVPQQMLYLFMRGYDAGHEDSLLQVVADWSRQPGQTRERILAAIRRLEELASRPERVRHAIHHELLDAQKLLSFDADVEKYLEQVNSGNYHSHHWFSYSFFRVVWSTMPWERWRTDRVLRWQSSVALRRTELLNDCAASPNVLPLAMMAQYYGSQLAQTFTFPTPERQARFLSLGSIDYHSAEGALLETSLLTPNFHYFSLQRNAELKFVSRVESFRATMLLLAIADFHRESGRYPTSLNELTPTYFRETPRSPLTNNWFAYFPQGLPEDGTRGDPSHGNVQTVVKQGIPFLASPNWTYSPLYTSRQKPDGTWEFVDDRGQVTDLRPIPYSITIWAVAPLEQE